jgi:hypothetical protein
MTSFSFVSTLLAKWRKNKRMGAVEQHRKVDHLKDPGFTPDFQGRWYAEHKEGFQAETLRPLLLFREMW